MDTKIWGPLTWNLLHDVAVLGDKIVPKVPSMIPIITRFFTLWQDLLPCVYCRQSFRRFSQQLPPQYPFRVWIYRIHNMVNQKLNKPLSLPQRVWMKRCKIYRCFGNTPQLWDLCFILMLNYNTKRQSAYVEWFQTLHKLYFYLVRYRSYDRSMTALFKSMDDSSHLVSQTIEPQRFMQWLVYYFVSPASSPFHGFSRFVGPAATSPFPPDLQAEYDRIVYRYRQSVASDDPEELWRLCGPFM